MFIESIDLVGVTIFDKAKVHKFKISPRDVLEPIMIEAFDFSGAIASYIVVRKQLISTGNKVYSNSDIISILDTNTGDTKMININDLPLVYDIDTEVRDIEDN